MCQSDKRCGVKFETYHSLNLASQRLSYHPLFKRESFNSEGNHNKRETSCKRLHENDAFFRLFAEIIFVMGSSRMKSALKYLRLSIQLLYVNIYISKLNARILLHIVYEKWQP